MAGFGRSGRERVYLWNIYRVYLWDIYRVYLWNIYRVYLWNIVSMTKLSIFAYVASMLQRYSAVSDNTCIVKIMSSSWWTIWFVLGDLFLVCPEKGQSFCFCLENSAAINLAMRLLRYSCFIWFLIYNIILLLYWTYETTNSTSPVKDGELSSFHKLASIPCYVLYTGMC